MTSLAVIADLIRARTDGSPPLIVGVTGAVAVGKSTFAGELAAVMGGRAVEVIATDGFLFPNAELEARGLLNRKGFPETYDAAALRTALTAIRGGRATIPAYSHLLYDIDPALARELAAPDVLIVEGLGLQQGAAALGLDVLVYLDADEVDVEAWFEARFIDLWRAAEHEPASFYARFRHMDETQTRALAGQVWRAINLPNLREHIVHGRDIADIVVRKGPDHAILDVTAREPTD